MGRKQSGRSGYQGSADAAPTAAAARTDASELGAAAGTSSRVGGVRADAIPAHAVPFDAVAFDAVSVAARRELEALVCSVGE